MKIDVYDTYAKSATGQTIHFDVFVPSDTVADAAFQFAIAWLEEIGQTEATLTQDQCRFCHQETASEAVVADIEKKGFYILQLEGCPNPAR